jgi:sulfonate transport system permease protein
MATLKQSGKPDLRGFVLPVLLGLTWWAISANGWGNAYIFITYDKIWSSFTTMAADGSLVRAFFGTVGRMAAGFAIGAGFGIALGLLTGLNQTAGRAISPSFHALRQIAVFAWMPLLTAWLGVGGQTIIALVALAAFYPTVINVEAGCRNVPLPYLEVGRALELSRRQMITRIILPAAAPAIFSGLELALATAWLATIGAEYFVSAGDGLGIILSASRMRGSMDGVIIGIIFVGLVGFAINRALAFFARRAFKWRAPQS